MSKKVTGITMAISGAIMMMISISFFKGAEWYDTVRIISSGLFLIGTFIIPDYTQSKKKEQTK